ncbi:MAG: hypothetical protein U0350_28000 [Caldilineaceae bacterium]
MLPMQVRNLRDRLLNGAGSITPVERQQIETYAARLSGAQRDPVILPAAIQPYVDKVTKYAYKVTDEDIEQLKAAGYSEDAIFEITISATLGASSACFERGLNLLQRGK